MSSRLFLLGFILSAPLWADSTLTSQIHEVDFDKNMTGETLVFLRSGRVVKLPKSNPKMAEVLMKKAHAKEWVNLQLNNNKEIVALQSIEAPLESMQKENSVEPYMPSVLGSLEWARRYFNESRYNSKDSQCFNRAHVWSHEWRVKHNFYSMKAYIFFTKKYIRKFNFDWWFHVAPLVHVVVNDKVEERVMDIKYARGPQKLKDWSDVFMRDDSACPIIKSYSEFADWPESSHCYIMRTSMYYYQPLDMENLEKFGYEKNRWIEAEVQGAYAEAFNLGL